MFYFLRLYLLSCNNSCAESGSPFEHAKNWFLKRRLDTNLCQVFTDVKYTRDTIRFKEKLNRLSSNTNNIHDTKNEVFRKGFI